MRYPLPTSAFSVLGLCLAAGCAPVEDVSDQTATNDPIVTRACPEAVVVDSAGQPRNAAGQIRQCWPTEARCYCDRDNDCYRLSRYNACIPVRTTPPAQDSGVRDTGPVDTGPVDTGPRDTGPVDTGPRDTGPVDTGPAPSGSVPTIGGCQMFPANNAWNQDVSALPVHPSSAAIIANIQAHGETTIKADFGSDRQYGIPITVAPAGQPFLPVTFNEYGNESDPGPYPAPTTSMVEGGNDRHVLVVHQGSCMLYEMYHAARSGSGWAAGSGAVFNLATNALRPAGWTSTDQAGLPIAPALARYEEVSAGEIRHALRVTFSHTRNGWIAPATHPGGDADVNAPPMGLRLRLRASFDISRYTGQARVILNALRRYGMFVADTGTNWFISGATDSRWNDTDLRQLTGVPGTAFEAVSTGSMQTW